MNPSVNGVGPGYFTTMGMPLVAGREFTERDTFGSSRVAVINQAMARQFFGDGPAVGHRFGFGRGSATDIEIVGVVRDSRSIELRDQPRKFVYVPYNQNEELTSLTFYVRTAAGTAPPAAAVRETVQRLDSALPVYDLKTMGVQVSESLFVDRMVASLSVAFGVLATLLAAIGLYGVMSYAVARRTREIAIRVALGAERARVLSIVLKEVALLVLAGVGLGLLVTIYLARQVESQLFGLSPLDPPTLLAATILVSLVALVAGYPPARRARRSIPWWR
jgi:predicted permease